MPFSFASADINGRMQEEERLAYKGTYTRSSFCGRKYCKILATPGITLKLPFMLRTYSIA